MFAIERVLAILAPNALLRLMRMLYWAVGCLSGVRWTPSVLWGSNRSIWWSCWCSVVGVGWMLNVLMTSWRTSFMFDNRFRKLHFGMEKDPLMLVDCCLQVGWCLLALIGYLLVCEGIHWTWQFELDHQQTQCHCSISSLLWLDLWSHIPWCYDSSTLYSMHPVWLANKTQKLPSLSAPETAVFSSMSLLRFDSSCEDIECHLGQMVIQKFHRLL